MTSPVGGGAPYPPDVSVVLPCLNEAESVALVVTAAFQAATAAGLTCEVVVADNGSTDDSAARARSAGARVISVPRRGYGNACHAGMSAARGRVVVMADADGTYPMESIPDLVAPVLAGQQDLVIGNRLQGRAASRAMPWTHRYIGNPLLTTLLNRLVGVGVSDAHSGMRALDRAAYGRLGLVTPGMEYASEMIVRAARAGLRIEERPIEYRDRVGQSKLQTWPDGWRHLKFLLLASPNWLFLVPGTAMFLVGLALIAPLGALHVGGLRLTLHPIFFGSALVIVGYQVLQFGLLVRACAPPMPGEEDRLVGWLHKHLTIERTLALGLLLLGAGGAIEAVIFVRWAQSGFADVFHVQAGVAAVTLCVLGTQTVFGGFLYAFFLPAGFAGGVAPAIGRVTAEETDHAETGEAATEGVFPQTDGDDG